MARLTQRQLAIYYAICVLLAVFALAPVAVLISDALRTDTAVATNTFAFPTAPQWGNFIAAWTQGAMGRALVNSAIYVVLTSVITCAIGGVAAYALVRMRVRFLGGVMAYLIVTTGLPIQSFLVPLFELWTHLHLYDTYLGLTIIYVATSLPFATLLIRSYLVQVPADFVEAARVDGASEVRIARSIVLPMIWPGLVSAAIVTGVGVYNDFIFAVTFIQSPSRSPASLSFYGFIQSHGLNYSLLAAGGLIVTAPMLIIFFVLQRRFVEGLAASGLRG